MEKVNNDKADVIGLVTPDIEKIVRYTIRQWASLNEQREPDHEDLIKNWLENDFGKWLNKQNFRQLNA